jgi:hypothetical protein
MALTLKQTYSRQQGYEDSASDESWRSLVHYPDLLFVRRCEQKFGINRGIYNTIDAWMHAHGFVDITERRTHIVRFLAKHAGNRRSPRGSVFGSGRLSACLEDYVQNI